MYSSSSSSSCRRQDCFVLASDLFGKEAIVVFVCVFAALVAAHDCSPVHRITTHHVSRTHTMYGFETSAAIAIVPNRILS